MTRGKGEGSVFYNEARKTWEGRIELPNPTGRAEDRRRKVIRRKSKPELLAEMAKFRTRLERAGDLPTASLTVDGYLDYWMREIAKKNLRPKAFDSTRSHVKWISQGIGNVRLDRVTPVHVRKVLAEMGDLSSTYKRNVHSTMSAAFGDAEREQRIARNPVDLVRAPLKSVTDLQVLTPAEAVDLIGAFGNSPDTVLWATFLLTGGRRGEAIGLEWDRVGDELDLSWQLQRIGYAHGCKENCGKRPPSCPDRTIDVPANYEYRHIKGGLYWTRPKSRAGWRIIPLVEPLKSILERWRAVAPENEWGLVFTREVERGAHRRVPVDPDFATTMWPEVLSAAGIDTKVRIHDLRHTTVDLLYAAGVPEDIIQEIVGHSTRAMSRSYKSKQNRERVVAAMRQLSSSLGFEDQSSSSM